MQNSLIEEFKSRNIDTETYEFKEIEQLEEIKSLMLIINLNSMFTLLMAKIEENSRKVSEEIEAKTQGSSLDPHTIET